MLLMEISFGHSGDEVADGATLKAPALYVGGDPGGVATLNIGAGGAAGAFAAVGANGFAFGACAVGSVGDFDGAWAPGDRVAAGVGAVSAFDDEPACFAACPGISSEDACTGITR